MYISHLVLDDEMKALVKEYGTGIESIDFPYPITWTGYRTPLKRIGRK